MIFKSQKGENMTSYRTAQGRTLDMSALAAKNEKTRAVGNMKVNARGDTIDSQGRVIEPVTSKVNKHYSKTVGNKSALPAKVNSIQPDTLVNDHFMDQDLMDLENDFNDETSIEIETIKQQEETKEKK